MTPETRPAPNFLIIGAAKCATTSLASLLELHPEAGVSRPKESHFFSMDAQYQFGWEAYLKLFAHCEGKKAIGDASTSYSRIRYHRQVIPRIQRHLSAPKIIYMVRHPLERMESAFAEHRKTPNGSGLMDLNDAIQRQPMIVDSSRYWEVFDAYRQAFGEAAIKVLWFEDYAARTLEVFQDACRFLDIDDTFEPELSQQDRNERAEVHASPVWNPALKARVVDAIREDNLRFLDHFGKDRGHWSGLYA